MPNDLKISVVTSCRNRVETIRDTIMSLLSQDYPNVEYIVVDANSDDGTSEIIDEYRDKITVLLREPDKNMYEGINKGIRLATGDVVGLLHSDDQYYATDTLSRIAHEFKRTKADYIYGNGIFVASDNPNCVVRNWISGDYVRSRLSKGWLPLHTTVYVRRDVYTECGLYDEKYKISSDTDWQLRCLYEHNLKVAYINDYIIRMRMGGFSTTWSFARRKMKEDLQIYKSHGFNRFISVTLKVAQKIPQYVEAKINNLKNSHKIGAT